MGNRTFTQKAWHSLPRYIPSHINGVLPDKAEHFLNSPLGCVGGSDVFLWGSGLLIYSVHYATSHALFKHRTRISLTNYCLVPEVLQELLFIVPQSVQDFSQNTQKPSPKKFTFYILAIRLVKETSKMEEMSIYKFKV